MKFSKWIVSIGAVMCMASSAVQAADYFRIGTGGSAGTYYPLGGMIANAITKQANGINASASTSNGSVANINAVRAGKFEAGLTQSDVAYWAFNATGTFEGKPPVSDLRLIATLYPESIHLVVRKDSGIQSVADLRGKRVSMDEPGSGTILDVRLILQAFGITEKDIKPEYLKPNNASDRLRDGAIDAYFFVGGAPAAAISELASSRSVAIDILPLQGPEIDKLRANNQFFIEDTIPANTYGNIGERKTIAVNAQLVTSANVSDKVIRAVVESLFSAEGQAILSGGHAKGKFITLENAVKGAGIPFHPAAEAFYREKGALK